MEAAMRVTKSENGLAVEIPADLAEALDLKEGDEVNLTVSTGSESSDPEQFGDREKALEYIRTRRWKLPSGWKFDRDEANER
jgi:antitoxin MazE